MELLFFGRTAHGLDAGGAALDHGGDVVKVTCAHFLLVRHKGVAHVTGGEQASNSGLRLTRLWQKSKWVSGFYLNAGTGSSAGGLHRELLSRTWGDNLDLQLHTGTQLGMGGILGVDKGDWLPYVNLGLEMRRVRVVMTQDQPGYDQTSHYQASQWARGYGLALGLKHRLTPDWVLHAPYEIKDLGEVRFHRPGYGAAYGLTYPDTEVRTRLAQSGFQIGISHPF